MNSAPIPIKSSIGTGSVFFKYKIPILDCQRFRDESYRNS